MTTWSAFSMQKATNDRDSFLESLKQTFTIIPIENVNGRALVEDLEEILQAKKWSRRGRE